MSLLSLTQFIKNKNHVLKQYDGDKYEEETVNLSEEAKLKLESFLTDVINLNLTHYGQQQQAVIMHNPASDIDNPSELIESYILKQFAPDLNTNVAVFEFDCDYTWCTLEAHSLALQKHLLESNADLTCFPFFVSV